MSQKTNAVAVRTIGIDTGKNTLHLIGLDEQGTIVLREKLARGRIAKAASECIALLDRDRGGYGDALCCPRAARARS